MYRFLLVVKEIRQRDNEMFKVVRYCLTIDKHFNTNVFEVDVYAIVDVYKQIVQRVSAKTGISFINVVIICQIISMSID